MAESPRVDRSFVVDGFVEPGPGGRLPDIEGLTELSIDSLTELVEFSVLNQWSGGTGFYRIGFSVQDADSEPLAISVGDEAVLRHTVAYDFQPAKPPLRQYLEVELHARDWGAIFISLDVNGIEVHRYPIAIRRTEESINNG